MDLCGFNMLIFCQLISFIQKKLLTTNYTLSTLPKTIVSFILKMELFSSQFSIFVRKKSVPEVSRTPLIWSHFLIHTKALVKKSQSLAFNGSHTMRVYLRDQTAKKEMKMFAFSTWRDHLVVNFSHCLKNGIRAIIYQGEIALDIKMYSTFFILHSNAFGSFFRKIQRKSFYSRFEALKLKNKINLSEYIHRHTNCIWSLSIHLLSI